MLSIIRSRASFWPITIKHVYRGRRGLISINSGVSAKTLVTSLLELAPNHEVRGLQDSRKISSKWFVFWVINTLKYKWNIVCLIIMMLSDYCLQIMEKSGRKLPNQALDCSIDKAYCIVTWWQRYWNLTPSVVTDRVSVLYLRWRLLLPIIKTLYKVLFI